MFYIYFMRRGKHIALGDKEQVVVDTKSGLMTLQQIADKAGVSRTAVSNWRKRHADFPEVAPESSTRSPLFLADEVSQWLDRRGITVESRRSAEAVAADMVQSSRLLSEDVAPVAAVALGLLAACRSTRQGQENSDLAKRFAEETEPRGILLAAIDLLDAEGVPIGNAEALSNALQHPVTDANESFVSELRNVVLAEADNDFPRLTELVMEEAFARRGSGIRGYLGHPASVSSQLLAEAAATSLPDDADTLLDPVCGTGDTLLRLATFAQGDVRVYGNEIEPVLADIARVRLWLHGINAVISTGNALSDGVLQGVAADVVVAEPPMGLRLKDLTAHEASPRDFWGVQGGLSGDAAFAIDAASRLAPGGRAYVLVPATLLTSTSQNRMREQLMARGMIEAIIEFPRKLLTYTAVATALLVLRGDHTEAIGVETTMIDATSRMPNGYTVAGWLRSVREGDTPTGSSVKVGTIRLTDIISGDASLLPSLRLATPMTSDQARSAKADARERFDEALDYLDEAIEGVQEASLPSTMDAQLVTLADLIDSGEVRLVRCHGGAEVHNSATPAATVYPLAEEDVKAARGNVPAETRRVEMGPDFETLLKGDIILPLTGKREAIKSIIGTDGYAVALGHAARGLRIEDNTRIDTKYLIWCLNAPNNAPASTTHGVPRRALRNIAVPLIPLSEQKRTVRHLDALEEVLKQAREVQTASEKLKTATLDWLPFS
jgi:hypothetical protein